MRISSVKIKQTESVDSIKTKGFSIHFHDCKEGEICVMLPVSSKNMEEAVLEQGWQILDEIITSH